MHEMQETERTYFRTLYEAVKVINSSLEPNKVFNTIAQQTAHALGAKACSLRLLDRTGKTLMQGAAWGLSRGYIRKGSVSVEKSALDQEALSGKTVYVKNAQNDPRFQYPQAAKEEGIASVLVVPLKLEKEKTKIIGVMRVYSGQERDFSESEIEFLNIMANLSAVAIENARLHQALKSDYELLTAFQYQTFED